MSLQSERDVLAGTKRSSRTEEQQRRFNSIPNLIRTRKAYLEEANELGFGYFTTYLLVQLLSEADNNLWTLKALATIDKKELPRHVGRGEEAVHLNLGKPFLPSQGKRDLDDGDVKWLDDGAGGVQLVQVGRCGARAWGRFLLATAEAGDMRGLPEDVRDVVATGEVTRELLRRLPPSLADGLRQAMASANVLSSYGAIYCAFEFGFVVVPVEDADEAWDFVSVTKQKPRYALRRSYVERRLRDTLATQRQPQVAP